MRIRYFPALIKIKICLLLLGVSGFVCAEEIRSQDYLVNVEVVAEGLNHPWSLAFLPDGNMLVTERTGNLRVIKNGKLGEKPVSGLPPIRQHGQGGLMDVEIHPEFQKDHSPKLGPSY